MADAQLRFGIPDIDIPAAAGGMTNPAGFAGHQLLVLFLPADRDSAERELRDYAERSTELCANDAWLFSIGNADADEAAQPECAALASDPGDRAWRAFQRLPGPGGRHDPRDGAAFLFSRGGGLQRAWFGAGHAARVARELARSGAV